MIAKGTPHDNGVRLARYLITGKEGEIAALWELSGFASTDIVEAFRSVHVMAAGTRCLQPFFHVQVRNRDSEFLTRDQWLIVADRIERVLGLAGQPRALAFHTDRQTGSEHMHLAFSRIDHETLTTRKLSFFKRRLNRVSRELEISLGLSPVNAERTSALKYAPLRAEEEQARRLGVDIREVLETIRACFDRSDCGRSFVSALTHSHLTLAKGERRDFVVIDQAGGIHALGKRLLGLSAARIRERLSDLAREVLPTVEQARQRISAEQGSRKKQAVEKRRDVRRMQDRLPRPAIEVNPLPSLKTQQAIEDRLGWTAVPDSPNPTAERHDPVSVQFRPIPNGKSAQEILPEDSSELNLGIRPLDLATTTLPAPSIALEANTDLTEEAEPHAETTPSTPRRTGIVDALKKQFRAVVKALVKRAPLPPAQRRRRRRGETVGSFRAAACSLLRPIVRLPGVSQTIAFLNDTVPWLHLWDWNEAAERIFEDQPPGTEGDHLSPHP